MTPHDYKIKHASALKAFLDSEAGRELIPTLHQLRPQSSLNVIPHIHYAFMERGVGFEICEKSILHLTTPPIPNEEIEATYGTETKTK